jgi:galactose mutarotase-like enzyme
VTTTDEVTLHDSTSTAVIEPKRGAIATRFDVGSHQVLFMDVETLRDPTKNVRGGIPVLFPTPGKLVGDGWSHAGLGGTMKQHGFARNRPWKVVEATANTAVLALESDDTTRAQFPWDFTFQMTFTLRGASLRLDQHIVNRSSTPMPFGVGFHPYFAVSDADKARTRITTTSQRAFDNVTKRTIDVGDAIDLTQKEVDLHLLDHGSTESSLITPHGTVRLRGSGEYTHWVVWTLAGRDFVCLEPWTCPGDALNTGDRLLVLQPSASRTLTLEIDYSA